MTDYETHVELVSTVRPYYELRFLAGKNPSGGRNNAWFYQDYGLNASDKMATKLLEVLHAGKRVSVCVTGKCNLNRFAEFTDVVIIP